MTKAKALSVLNICTELDAAKKEYIISTLPEEVNELSFYSVLRFCGVDRKEVFKFIFLERFKEFLNTEDRNFVDFVSDLERIKGK